MPGLRLTPTTPAPNAPVIDLEFGQSKTVGRGRQADVVVDDPSLSRLHARIAVDQDGQISVDDLGSTNGIFVNGAEQLSAYLMIGDTIRFGRIEYLVSSPDDTRPTTKSGVAPVASQTVLRRVALNATPKVDRIALEALLATSREMMAFEDLPALLERVLDRLSSIVKPDRAAIMLIDPQTGGMIPRAVRTARSAGASLDAASTSASASCRLPVALSSSARLERARPVSPGPTRDARHSSAMIVRSSSVTSVAISTIVCWAGSSPVISRSIHTSTVAS